MNVWLFGAGVALLVAVVLDVLWTTLWVDGGAGPLSSRLMSVGWRGLRTAGGDGGSTLLSLAGPLLVASTFLMWIGLLLAGWTFVFASGGSVLVDTHGGDPISWYDRVYFVAYAIFTLGIGDIIPREGGWQIATVLTTATGMLFITLGVSYVVSILGAVSRKRSFASSVTSLGTDPETFVLTGWTGESFEGFEFTLAKIAQEIDYLAYQYKAYPILHYYHSGETERSTAVAVAILDDALTVLRFGVPEEHRPNGAILENAHASTGDYVQTLGTGRGRSAERTPPPPGLDRLRDAGVPTVADETFAAALAELGPRRRRLLALVEDDAWRWPSAAE